MLKKALDPYVLWHGFKIHPWNEPMSRPGVYLATNLKNKKVYVGISYSLAKRCKSHAKAIQGRPAKRSYFRTALRKYGPGSFLLEPLFYCFKRTKKALAELPVAEAILIKDYDSVTNGYNIQGAKGSVGPYTNKFGKIIQRAFKRNGTAKKLRALWQDPKHRAFMSARNAEVANRPEMLVFRRAMWNKFWADPTKRSALIALRNDPKFRKRVDRNIRCSVRTPEERKRRALLGKDPIYRKKLSKAKLEYWNDSKRSATHRKSVGEASRQARLAESLATRKKRQIALRAAWRRNPRGWITNGKEIRYVFKSDPIPVGWWRGRIITTKQAA